MVHVVKRREYQEVETLAKQLVYRLSTEHQLDDLKALIASRNLQEDLEKIRDVLRLAFEHHQARDTMNAIVHVETVRWSPLTLQLASAGERLDQLLEDSTPKERSSEKQDGD